MFPMNGEIALGQKTGGGNCDGDPSGNEPGQCLQERRRAAAQFGLGHGASIEIGEEADGNPALTGAFFGTRAQRAWPSLGAWP